MENVRRKTVLVQVRRGYHAYREMLHYYAVKNLLEYIRCRPEATAADMAAELSGERCRRWVNLGGQLVKEPDLDRLRADIREGKLQAWPDVHREYDRLWKDYPLDKQRHALACLLLLSGAKTLDPKLWNETLAEMVRIQNRIRDEVYRTRKKDYDNPYRQATFRNAEEMRATIGTAEDNSFVKQVRAETENLVRWIESIM
jgi:hypothetical protein